MILSTTVHVKRKRFRSHTGESNDYQSSNPTSSYNSKYIHTINNKTEIEQIIRNYTTSSSLSYDESNWTET